MSNITLNIVEPSSPTPTPINPGVDPAVPSTGLFTSGIGGAEAAIIATVTLVVILAIIGAIIYRKKKTCKQGNAPSLLAKCKQTIKSKKHASGLAVLALLVSIGTVAGLLKLGASAADDGLTVTTSSEELTIELADEPVFAVLPVELTVAEATQTGYTLTAYAEDTDLVSTTDSSKTVPMVVADEAELVALTDNTYGLALVEPEDKDSEVYTALSTDQSNPTIIKSMTEYTPTEENDTTTTYYGFYITPDTPYGTYEGVDIYYNATINTTPVTFDGNGLYFNEDQTQTTNEIEYIAVPQEGSGAETSSTINQIISGEYKEPSQSLPYNFLGWSTDSTATVPTYISEQSIAEFLPILPNTPLTIYAVWQKATTITYDSNGGTGDMNIQTIIAGESTNLYENTFVKDGYHFTGWNTVAEPTEQEPGEAYEDQADFTAPATSQNLTLYAQWEEDILYMQDVATWGSTLSQGDTTEAVDKRDGQEYTVARLADNKIWMTKNLNLAGGTVITSELSNVPEGYTLPTANGFQSGNKLPASSTSGFSGDAQAYVYNSTKTSGTDCSSPGCYSYYSWTAATAGSGLSITANNTDAPYSICPKGWKLPNSRSTVAGNSDFYKLAVAYGMNPSSTSQSTSNFYNQAGPGTPPNFLLTGYYYNGSLDNGGSFGFYWSSTSYYSSYAWLLNFDSSFVGSARDVSRRGGYAVRCIAQ